MPHDPVVRFKVPKTAEATDIVEGVVNWMVNGMPAGVGVIKRTALGDLSGYTVKFSDHNPTIKLGDGDKVDAYLKSVDGSGKSPEPLVGTFDCPDSPPPNFIEFTIKAI